MKGKLTISRMQSSHSESDVVRIYLTDESSRIQFVDVTMSLENFASALMNLAERDCEFELRGAENVGKLCEQKTEVVTVRPSKKYHRLTEEEVTAALAPFEVDGWSGRRSDVDNMHARVRATPAPDDGSYKARVHFSRFVDAPADEQVVKDGQ